MEENKGREKERNVEKRSGKEGTRDFKFIGNLFSVGSVSQKTTCPKLLCSLDRFGQWETLMGNWKVGGKGNPGCFHLSLLSLLPVHLQQ